jgi:Polysaccharide biosynthesis protein
VTTVAEAGITTYIVQAKDLDERRVSSAFWTAILISVVFAAGLAGASHSSVSSLAPPPADRHAFPFRRHEPPRPRTSAATSSEADARIRTGDPFITSEVLYQLSYVGAAPIVAPLWRPFGAGAQAPKRVNE